MLNVTGGLPTGLVYLPQITAGNEKLKAYHVGNAVMKSCTSSLDQLKV